MKTLITILILFPSIMFGQLMSRSQADSLRALQDVKYKFVVSFDRMMYEYELRTLNDSIIAAQKEIIHQYELLTGIQARSREDLKEAYRIKQEVSRASEELLEAAIQGGKKATRRKKFWKTTAIVGIPSSLIGGFVLANKLK